jgi:nitroreductase
VDHRPAPEFPLITAAQRAGDMDTLGDPWPQAAPLETAPPASPDLDTVILQRGSTRIFDAAAAVARETFAFMLEAALRGSRVPHFVAVHGVDGLEPGLYRWPDLQHPRRREPLRQELLSVCWDQDLGRDAAFVAIGTADLSTIDDRGYREAQLDSGIVEGRLHLAAYALGLGATGMTFIDTEIEPLLREPLGALLFTCVGVQPYRTTAGGRPGAPVDVVARTAGITEASGG